MDGMTLLAEAQEAGLTVLADGDRLVVRGPKSAEKLARRLLQNKAQVMAALNDAPAGGGPEPAAGRPDATPGVVDKEMTTVAGEEMTTVASEMGTPPTDNTLPDSPFADWLLRPDTHARLRLGAVRPAGGGPLVGEGCFRGLTRAACTLPGVRQPGVVGDLGGHLAVSALRPAHYDNSAVGTGHDNPSPARQGRAAWRGGNVGRLEKADRSLLMLGLDGLSSKV